MSAGGKHERAKEGSEKAAEPLVKHVACGFLTPVSPEIVDKIRRTMVQPLLGLLTQRGPTKDRSRKVKRWFAQDLSFSLMEEDVSINSQINLDWRLETFHGWCVSHCVTHFSASARLAHPNKHVFILERDCSDAC